GDGGPRKAGGRPARAALPQTRRRRRLLRPRAFLRTDQAAEGNLLFHIGRRGQAAGGRRQQDRPDREELRHGLSLHADRAREGRDPFPSDLRPGEDGGLGHAPARERPGEEEAGYYGFLRSDSASCMSFMTRAESSGSARAAWRSRSKSSGLAGVVSGETFEGGRAIVMPGIGGLPTGLPGVRPGIFRAASQSGWSPARAAALC